jgi:hypothetical protein
MKNQNPQEILNEILLRMKYDSSMTLSENKKIIDEQRTPYYDSQGFLKYVDGPVAIPQGGVAASKVYPNLKPGEYPNYNFTLGTTAKPAPFNKPQIPQSDVLGPQGSYTRSLGIDRQSLETKAALKAKQDEKLKDIAINKGMYQNELNELKRKYNVDGMISPQNYVPTNMDNYKEELNNYIKKYNNYKENILPKYLKEKEILDKKYGLWKFPVESIDSDINIPKNSTKEFFKKEDFKDSNTIKKSFHTKLNDSQLKRFTTNEPSGTYISTPNWTPTKGDLFDWIWSKVKDEIKFFILPEPYNKLEWKKRLYINNSGYFTVSDKYYAQGTDGQYIPYVKTDFADASFWEEYGPTILNIASMAIAVLGPATWPLLLISAGLDLTAAKMQYEQGDVEGAKLSALLSLTPFLGKFAIKVPKVKADALAQKFINATTKDDVDRIVTTLTADELNTLKSLRELGDIKKIQSMVNDPEVKTAINIAAKNSKGIASKALQKGATELSVGVALFMESIPRLQQQELENLNRKQVINKVIGIIIDSTNITDFMSDTEKQEAKEIIPELLPMDKFVAECKRKTEIIRKAQQKALEQENKQVLDKTMETIKELEKYIEFLDSQKETDENKLTDDEINNLTN